MKSFFNTSSDDKETTRKLRGFPAISPSPLLSFRFFLFYRFISFESGSLIWSRDFLLDIWMNPWMFASFKGMMDLRSFMESSWQPGLNLAYHPNLVKVFPLSISSMSEEVTQQSVADVGVAWVGPRQLNYVSTPANRYVDTCHLAYIGPKLCRMSPWQLGPSGRLLVASVYLFYIINILNSCKWPIPSMWTVKWIGPMTLLGWYIGTVSLCLDCAATLVIRGNIMELPGVLLEVSFLFQSVGQSSGPQQSPNHYLSRPLLFG